MIQDVHHVTSDKMSEENHQPGTPETGQSGPVYQELSSNVVWALRIVGACTLVMVLFSFIFTLVQAASENSSFYLLTCNLIISAFVGAVNAFKELGFAFAIYLFQTWWYRQGDLTADKYWFLLVVCGVILFQCLTTDVFVFNIKPYHGDDEHTTINSFTMFTAIPTTTTASL